jgi:hypothetical protein
MWTAKATGHEIVLQISSRQKKEPLVQRAHKTVKQKVATGWNKVPCTENCCKASYTYYWKYVKWAILSNYGVLKVLYFVCMQITKSIISPITAHLTLKFTLFSNACTKNMREPKVHTLVPAPYVW